MLLFHVLLQVYLLPQQVPQVYESEHIQEFERYDFWGADAEQAHHGEEL